MADNMTIRDASGASVVVASDDVGGVEYQRVKNVWGADGVATDVSGAAPMPTVNTVAKPVYFYAIPTTVHVAVANTVMWDLWNADSTLIVRVLSIRHIPDMVTAVAVGVPFAWLLERTTSVGTGGTAQTAALADTSDTGLSANITCRLKPTGGAAQSTDLVNYQTHGEETNVANNMAAALGGLEVLPPLIIPPFSMKGLVLRPSQGIRCVQITSSALGNSLWFIAFTVE